MAGAKGLVDSATGKCHAVRDIADHLGDIRFLLNRFHLLSHFCDHNRNFHGLGFRSFVLLRNFNKVSLVEACFCDVAISHLPRRRLPHSAALRSQ